MESNRRAKSLYICYLGLDEPLVQTQVLPYLRQLRKGGVDVHLLTFDRRQGLDALQARREELRSQGIAWTSLRYHKWPSLPATLYDIVMGVATIARLVRGHQVEVLHARSHVPAAMALLLCRPLGCSFIFDIRGFMAEEYVDASVWRERSARYRVVKMLERASIRRADQIVVLTRRMRDWIIASGLAGGERIHVIPCCVDLTRFKEHAEPALVAAKARPEVVYVGSTAGLYLFEEVGRLFLSLRGVEPSAFLRVLTASSVEEAGGILRQVGVAESDFVVSRAPPDEVPRHLRQARLGISLRKPTFAQIAASPTKIPEYLAAGVPVICNAGIGDMDELLVAERVGVILREFSAAAYRQAAVEAFALAGEPDTRERCRKVARTHFDLESIGGPRYVRVYELLPKGARASYGGFD